MDFEKLYEFQAPLKQFINENLFFELFTTVAANIFQRLLGDPNEKYCLLTPLQIPDVQMDKNR